MPTDATFLPAADRRAWPGRRIGLRYGVMAALALVFVVLMRARLGEVSGGAILHAARGVSPANLLVAVGMTAVSFWAVGRYDGVLHRLMGTRLAPRAAHLTGAAAIAVSQTLGLGLITGSLVRWRLLPGLNPGGAARLTALVAATFLAGWACVTGLCLLLLAPAPWLAPFGWITPAVMLALVALSLSGRVRAMPSVVAMAQIVTLCAADTLAAAAALFVLIPLTAAPEMAVFLPAFLLALGAGLISGTPGGAGPFEVTLLALLPGAEAAPVLAGVLLWRLVYFALPATLGALIWIKGPQPAARAGPCAVASTDLSPPQRHAVLNAPHAEAQLLFQGHKSVLTGVNGAALWVTAPAGQSVIALGDPLLPDTGAALDALKTHAAQSWRTACLYKCSARTARVARLAGFAVMPISEEAWLRPADFSLETPSRRQLRRKLRKAEQAGVRVRQAQQLPLAAMARVNRGWTRENGGERGFSMGRYCPHYLQRQLVYLAYHEGQLMGFASFHSAPAERTLDLMRLLPGAPEGTMQALLTAAIADAARARVPRLSLAAVPLAEPLQSPPLEALRRRLSDDHAGLRRFKSAFAPQWQRLYIAAPTRLGLVVAGHDIARQILRPPR